MKRKIRTTFSDADYLCRRQLGVFLEERSEDRTSQELEIELQNQLTIIDDLLFKILVLVPAESLFRLQFVCKKLFNLINSSIFIRCAAQQSETVLICKKLTKLQPVTPHGGEKKFKYYFHFVDLESGRNSFMDSSFIGQVPEIVASCDGLILARLVPCKKLMILNPVTRKHSVVLIREKWITSYSFGIAYSSKAKTNQVVHLFSDKFRAKYLSNPLHFNKKMEKH